jgi:hypothetical protein
MDEKKTTLVLLIIYAILAFVFVSLQNTYQMTSNIFNNGNVDNKWGSSSLNMGVVVHGVVFLLLLWLPMLLSKKNVLA